MATVAIASPHGYNTPLTGSSIAQQSNIKFRQKHSNVGLGNFN